MINQALQSSSNSPHSFVKKFPIAGGLDIKVISDTAAMQ